MAKGYSRNLSQKRSNASRLYSQPTRTDSISEELSAESTSYPRIQQPSTGSLLDLDESNTTVQIKKEPAREIEARIQNESDTTKFNRKKEAIVLIVLGALFFLILIFCAYIIISPNNSPVEKQPAWSLSTLILGGILGYITGKSQNK